MGSGIKLVIFDLDGTLVDAYKAVASSLNHTLIEVGCAAVNDDTIKRTVGWGDRHLVGSFVGEEKLEQAMSIYRQHHARAIKSGTTFLPGARKLLGNLKDKGYKLAVASNRPTRFTHIILKHLQVNRIFDCVLCGDKVARPKPEADILTEILGRLALRPDEALYVGDMTIDVETGHKAGVKTVAVATGSSTKEEIDALKPLAIIDRVIEVERVLETMRI